MSKIDYNDKRIKDQLEAFESTDTFCMLDSFSVRTPDKHMQGELVRVIGYDPVRWPDDVFYTTTYTLKDSGAYIILKRPKSLVWTDDSELYSKARSVLSIGSREPNKSESDIERLRETVEYLKTQMLASLNSTINEQREKYIEQTKCCKCCTCHQ